MRAGEVEKEAMLRGVRSAIVTSMISQDLCLVKREELIKYTHASLEQPIATLTDDVIESLSSGLEAF